MNLLKRDAIDNAYKGARFELTNNDSVKTMILEINQSMDSLLSLNNVLRLSNHNK